MVIHSHEGRHCVGCDRRRLSDVYDTKREAIAAFREMDDAGVIHDCDGCDEHLR